MEIPLERGVWAKRMMGLELIFDLMSSFLHVESM